MSQQIALTDPARELTDLCMRLITGSTDHGAVYLAKKFRVEQPLAALNIFVKLSRRRA